MRDIPITTENRLDILQGKICPYCGDKTEFKDSACVYGQSYGMIYICEICEAWVGVHKGSNRSLGRLADAELRTLKKEAHGWFDPIWQKKQREGTSKLVARFSTYRWLAEQMRLPLESTHIGMFNVAQCKQAIELCKSLYKITKQ